MCVGARSHPICKLSSISQIYGGETNLPPLPGRCHFQWEWETVCQPLLPLGPSWLWDGLSPGVTLCPGVPVSISGQEGLRRGWLLISLSILLETQKASCGSWKTLFPWEEKAGRKSRLPHFCRELPARYLGLASSRVRPRPGKARLGPGPVLQIKDPDIAAPAGKSETRGTRTAFRGASNSGRRGTSETYICRDPREPPKTIIRSWITQEEWPAMGGGPWVVTTQFHLEEEEEKGCAQQAGNVRACPALCSAKKPRAWKQLDRLTNFWKASRCVFRQRTFPADAGGKGWAVSSRQTAPAGPYTQRGSLRLSATGRNLQQERVV